MSDEKKKAPLSRTEVVVKKEGHTHAGEPCDVGAKIMVTEHQKAWLEKQGVIDAS